MLNAKNRLYEFVKELGCYEQCVQYQSSSSSPNGNFISQATVTFADGRKVVGTGSSFKKVEAEIAAAEHALSIIAETHQDMQIDWKQVFMEAQAGDALIKLCAYLSESFETAEQKSLWLQTLESDEHLADIFDRLQSQNDSSVSIFGPNLGSKRKATWIEALIWREFGALCLSANAKGALNDLSLFLKN